MTNTLRISEIFGPTIQGEGNLIGRPTVFVRTGGCDYRCTWCDTLHAVKSKYREHWTPLTTAQIMQRVVDLTQDTPILITLSGGNPATQDCTDLIKTARAKGYTFALETQGSIPTPWFEHLSELTLSPKPPSSGMDTNWQKLEECMTAASDNTTITLKIVIKDEADYQYAREVNHRYPFLPITLQPCNLQANNEAADTEALNTALNWLLERIKTDNWYAPRILPQLHVHIWGNKKGV